MPVPNSPTEAFVQKQVGTAGVFALIAARLYPDIPTQEPTYPYGVVSQISGGGELRLSGPNQLQEYMLGVEAHATTQAGAFALLDAMIAAVAGWVDVTNKVKGCFPSGDRSEDTIEETHRIARQTFRLFYLG